MLHLQHRRLTIPSGHTLTAQNEGNGSLWLFRVTPEAHHHPPGSLRHEGSWLPVNT